MDRIPGDLYEPENHPLVPAKAIEEEEPEEDPEEEPEENSEENSSKEEYEPTETPESDEEVVPSPSPPVRTYFQPHCLRGQERPSTRTPKVSVRPRILPDISPFLSQPTGGQKRKATNDPPRFEKGESSQVPPRGDPISPVPSNRLPNQVKPLEEIIKLSTDQRVDKLEKETKEDSGAIQTLFHNIGASRTEVNRLGMTVRSMEYEIEVSHNRQEAAENRAAIAEKELRLLRQHLDELGEFVTSRLI